jgi:hypothetical protein
MQTHQAQLDRPKACFSGLTDDPKGHRDSTPGLAACEGGSYERVGARLELLTVQAASELEAVGAAAAGLGEGSEQRYNSRA